MLTHDELVARSVKWLFSHGCTLVLSEIKCRNNLKEVSNGFFGAALFCPKCEIVYVPKLVKVPNSKVSKEFLEQCKE